MSLTLVLRWINVKVLKTLTKVKRDNYNFLNLKTAKITYNLQWLIS